MACHLRGKRLTLTDWLTNEIPALRLDFQGAATAPRSYRTWYRICLAFRMHRPSPNRLPATRWPRKSMKFPFGIRLWILIATLLVVAGGTIYGLSFAWRRIEQVEAKLTASQIERFQLSSEIRREMQSLNSSVLRYALLRDPEQWKMFEQTSIDLHHLIQERDPNRNPHSPLTTEEER